MEIRFGGIASGMDTESIVQKLMQAERMPLDRMKRSKQILEWQRDDYRTLNKAMEEFRTYLFDKMLKQNTYIPKTVTSSNSTIVTATANANAADISTSINVTTLATSSKWVSENSVSDTWKASDSGLTFTDGKIDLSFTRKDPSGTESSVKKITINETDSISTIINKFNSSGLGISAMKGNFDRDGNGSLDGDTIVFMNKTSGSGNYSINSQDATTVTFMNTLGFTSAAVGGDLGGFTQGIDAELSINGMSTVQKSNTFEISGVTYTLQNTGTATITTKTDVDTAYNNIKEFVDKYNELITTLNGKVNEPRYRSFQPLTSEQKEAMSDKEVELWEEKAKSGLIKGDSIISSGLSNIRIDVYSKVAPGDKGINSTYDTLTEIGITTTKTYMDGGLLEINETKLRDALTKDPNTVYELFTKTTDSDLINKETKEMTSAERQEKYNESGLAIRLRESLYDTINKIEDKAGNQFSALTNYTLGKNIDDIDDRIDNFERRLKEIEDRYWSQFTAMETAMQKANGQSAYLMQQFSNM